jgi:1,4-alpha-glucan branching enzyme
MKVAPLFLFIFFFVLGFGPGSVLFSREPIPAVPKGGWETTYTLSNEALELTVAPLAGRIIHLALQGENNLFTRNEAIVGDVPESSQADWLNHGGDWMWPVHQGQWKTLRGVDWPPPNVMEGSDWKAEAWTEADGTGVIILRRTLGAPVFIEAERRIELLPGKVSELRIRQSIRRINASDIPVCLWQISQIARPDAVVIGTTEDSPFPEGIHSIAFDPIPKENLTFCEGGVTFAPLQGTEHKLGTDARWIAARRDNTVLMQWTFGGRKGGELPDGGCGVVVYANAGLGYAEIETQSAEVALAPGEVLRNELVYRLIQLDEEIAPCDLVSRLHREAPQSQRVRFEPATPILGEPVTVRVLNPEGGGMLHWGVNGPAGDWQLPLKGYRPEGSTEGETGVAVDTPLPPPVDGLSTLQLGPFRDPAQVVRSLHAAVRWGDVWDSHDGANYNVSFSTHPDASSIEWVGEIPEALEEILPLRIETRPFADSVRLLLDGREIAKSRDGTLSVKMDTTSWSYGAHDLTAKAEHAGHFSVSQRKFWKIPELKAAPDLPESFPYGATRTKDSFRLHLLAPNARFVEVDWKTEDKQGSEMMQTLEGGRWTIEIPADAGSTLRYQYRVEGTRRFADPWSTQVDWRHPETGLESHLPEHAWSVVGTLPAALPDWTPPSPETWVIYELSIPDVAPPGSYKGLEGRLDWIKNLGINAIEPLPVTAFPGAESWGYNPSFHMAPEGAYGSPADLADLILAARERGIAYVKDIVLNHVDASGPLNAMHGPAEQNPFTMVFEGFNWGFPKLDQESEALKRYIRDTLTHWVVHWGVDGYRYDATQWIKWSGYNDWGASWMSYVVQQANPNTVQVAENLPSEPNMVKGTELDGEWDGHYRWRMRKVFIERKITEPEKFREILDPRSHAYQTGWQRVPYIESHDEERFMRELLEASYDEEEALRRHHAAAAITLTVPGMPMLYAGQEWGESTEKVVGLNPLQWKLSEKPARAALVEKFRDLIQLRTTHRALHHDRIDILRLDPETGTVVYKRPGVPESILVAFNISAFPAILDLSGTGTPVSELHHSEDTVPDLREIKLLPGEARVFRVR